MTPQQHLAQMIDDLPYHLRNTVTIGVGPVTYLRVAAADHIDAQAARIEDMDMERRAYIGLLSLSAAKDAKQAATIKALVEALGKLERICKNGQPDKISDGVKIASDAIALSNIPRDA